MSRLKTEFPSQRDGEPFAASSGQPSQDWFRWESQGHADFVAIQVNMLLRLAARRELYDADTRD